MKRFNKSEDLSLNDKEARIYANEDYRYEVKEEESFIIYVYDKNDNLVNKVHGGDSYSQAKKKVQLFERAVQKKVEKHILTAVFYVSVANMQESKSYLEIRMDIPIRLNDYKRIKQSSYLRKKVVNIAQDYMQHTKVKSNSLKDIYLEYFSDRQYHFRNFRPKSNIGFELDQFRTTKSLDIEINSKVVFGGSEYSSRSDIANPDRYLFDDIRQDGLFDR